MSSWTKLATEAIPIVLRLFDAIEQSRDQQGTAQAALDAALRDLELHERTARELARKRITSNARRRKR